jgi:hypothetical protein
MSSALVIASVTAVLKNLLDNGLIQHGIAASLGDASVTVLPPDRIPVGTEERTQLNLFLYRVTPNTGWRNSVPPQINGNGNGNGKAGSLGNASDGAVPPDRPPLALDLHYLLTAYGEQDLQAEILLGYAMQLFHQTSTLDAPTMRQALEAIGQNGTGGGLSAARTALAAADLSSGVPQIAIFPEFLSTEETSKLFSMLQARYRPSAAYRVSTVLIEAHR